MLNVSGRLPSASKGEPTGNATSSRFGYGSGTPDGSGASGAIEATHLLGFVQDYLDGSLIDRLAALLGEGAPKTRMAVDAVLPPLLVGLVGAASRPSRKNRVAVALEDVDEGLLDGLCSSLDGSVAEAIRQLGDRTLRRLLGEQSAVHFVSRAARYTQLDISAARLLLGVLVPIALASIKRLMKMRGFAPDAPARLVAAEQARGRPRTHSAPPVSTAEFRSSPVPVGRPAVDRVLQSSSLTLGRLSTDKPGRLASAVAFVWSLLLCYWAVLPQPYAPRGAPAQNWTSRLSLSNIGSQIEYSGVVTDESSRSTVLELLAELFGESNLVGDLRVDARVRPPKWLNSLKPAIVLARKPGVDLQFSGNRVDVADMHSESDSFQLIRRLQSLYGSGFAVRPYQHERERGPPKLAQIDAALAALGTGFVFSDFVAVLEAWVINFPTESDEIPIEHRPLIRHAAHLMGSLPEGTVIEVGGYTDDTGDPAVNLMLSRVRAESVREALIDAGANPALVRAAGHGSERPVASNERPEGRLLNRRIEFFVIQN